MERDFVPSYCIKCHCITAHKIDCKDHVVTYTCSVCKSRKGRWDRADDDKKPDQENQPRKPK